MDRTKPEAPDGVMQRDTAASSDVAAARSDEPRTEAGSSDGAGRADDLRVIVTVTRSGGIAGIRRSWRAQAEEDAASRWIARIEECPWDAVEQSRPAEGADRFMWDVNARCGEEARRAELADSDVQGPWRELIDAVREEGTPVPRASD
jgi:hypothetical protein